eukprot:scaffold2109_cov123-Isochrysis_galbana.AAC.15
MASPSVALRNKCGWLRATLPSMMSLRNSGCTPCIAPVLYWSDALWMMLREKEAIVLQKPSQSRYHGDVDDVRKRRCPCREAPHTRLNGRYLCAQDCGLLLRCAYAVKGGLSSACPSRKPNDARCQLVMNAFMRPMLASDMKWSYLILPRSSAT